MNNKPMNPFNHAQHIDAVDKFYIDGMEFSMFAWQSSVDVVYKCHRVTSKRA